MSEPVFILRNQRGHKLLTFATLTDARKYRDAVQNERVRFDIIRQTIVEELVA